MSFEKVKVKNASTEKDTWEKKRLYQILGYVKNGRGNGKMEPAFEVFR